MYERTERMELFLPSILVALVAIIFIILIVPRFSPLIIAIIAGILLYVGMSQHLQMFWNEYEQSTWQKSLTLFAPGIMIAAIILFVIYGILAFFSGGAVPIPTLPTLELPSANTATNPVTAALNTAMNTVGNAAESVTEATNNAINAVNNTVKNIGNAVTNNTKAKGRNNSNSNNSNNGRNNANSGPSRSYLATA